MTSAGAAHSLALHPHDRIGLAGVFGKSRIVSSSRAAYQGGRQHAYDNGLAFREGPH